MTGDLSRREALKAIGAGVPALGLASGMGGQQSAAATEHGPPEWEGKVLVAYTRSLGSSMPVILTECRFESPGGRLFVAGVDQSCRRSLKEWSEGARRWVAWETVEGYLIFDSLDDYYNRLDEDREEPGGGDAPDRPRD